MALLTVFYYCSVYFQLVANVCDPLIELFQNPQLSFHITTLHLLVFLASICNTVVPVIHGGYIPKTPSEHLKPQVLLSLCT
jgi:hypothetical protein